MDHAGHGLESSCNSCKARLAPIAFERSPPADAGGALFDLDLAQTVLDHLNFGVALFGKGTRLLFINLIYDKLEKPKKTKGPRASAQEFDALRANYLRYTEAAINMILPVLLFAFVYPKYSAERLGGAPTAQFWWAGGIAVAAALFFVGMFTYRSYLEKAGQVPQAAQE